MLSFGRSLPQVRSRVARDLRRRGSPREKVLATLIRLLEGTFIRIGNDEYSRENSSYGLTTLRDHHTRVKGDTTRFEFVGKSGQRHSIEIEDRRLARIIRRCRELPGQSLFQYRDEDGRRRSVSSTDVNEYLREIAGDDYSTKDFRTWAGTVLAAEYLGRCSEDHSRSQRRAIVSAIDEVARRLGNTPAVCRKCYVHPLILDAFQSGRLRQEIHRRTKPQRHLRSAEAAVLRLLQNRRTAASRH